MPKLKVSAWQYDEIEAIVNWNPGGPEWFAEHVELEIQAYAIENLPDVYIFFGPIERMDRWKAKNQNLFKEYDRVLHASQANKLQGSRAIVKRVYDIDGDRTWYWNNRLDEKVQWTLEVIYHTMSMNGNTHFEDLPKEEQIYLWTKKRKYEVFWREVPRDKQNEIMKQGKTHPAHPEYEETANA